MKTTEIGRKRLRSIAHRLTREGDDHTMSGTFGQYYEGDSVTEALDDLEACLVLLRAFVDADDMCRRGVAAGDDAFARSAESARALLASGVSR